MKTCTKCASTENGFARNKDGADGLRSICLQCDKERRRAFYLEHKQEICSRTKGNYLKRNGLVATRNDRKHEAKPSNAMEIYGYPGYSITPDGRVYSDLNSIFLETNMNRGYEKVCVKKNGNTVTLKVHRLVAVAFVPNPQRKPHINHIDGNKANNICSNIEWCTHSENMSHWRTLRRAAR